jgi:IS4 transposase
MGIRGRVARSTLAEANEARPWQMYADLAHSLIHRARQLYKGEELDVELGNTVYALDSTTIEVSLGLFPWAKHRSYSAGVKMHTLLDLRGSIPASLVITPSRVHDVTQLDTIPHEPGSIYVMDRGYLDFGRLFELHSDGCFFVIRAKDNLNFVRYRSQVHTDERVRADQLGRLRGFYSRQSYPDLIRRVRFFDPISELDLIFLTNLFEADALSIARLYKYRWNVELFFKWIKQNLRIKAFYGTSMNAVQTQLWIAVCVYVLVAIVKKQLHLRQSLHSILQVVSVHPFEKVSLVELLTELDCEESNDQDHNQLTFSFL